MKPKDVVTWEDARELFRASLDDEHYEWTASEVLEALAPSVFRWKLSEYLERQDINPDSLEGA